MTYMEITLLLVEDCLNRPLLTEYVPLWLSCTLDAMEAVGAV